MDNIKSLIEKQQYELVLELTKKPLNNEDIFYRITSFVALNRPNEALFCLKQYQKQLEKDLPILMKMHIQLLCALELFDKAYEEVKYYEQLSYHSQAAEEVLKTLNSFIRQKEKETFKGNTTSDDDIKNRLKSNDAQVVLAALNQLRNKKVDIFCKEISNILISFPKPSIRAFALMGLVEKKCNMTFKFLSSKGDIIEVNPSKLEIPFSDQDFILIMNKIDLFFNDVSLSRIGGEILSTYVMYNYPDKVEINDEFLEALYNISCAYMKKENKVLKERCLRKGLDYSRVTKIIEDLNYAMANF